MAELIDSPPVRSAVDDARLTRVSRSWAPWFEKVYTLLFAMSQSGVTAQRPSADLWTGRPFFDTTLGLPIWWDGSQWIKADGTPA